MGKNHKRVMDVWMDEYKEFIYMRRPHYRNIDPGKANSAEHVEFFSINFFENNLPLKCTIYISKV